MRVHQVTLALECEDPDQALQAAAGWTPPRELPVERASHYFIDVARAHHLLGRQEVALANLRAAWQKAPEHTRLNPHVRALSGLFLVPGLAEEITERLASDLACRDGKPSRLWVCANRVLGGQAPQAGNGPDRARPPSG